MSRIAYLVTLRAHAGRRDALLLLLAELVEAAALEPGTEVYVIHTLDAEPDLVLTYEVFADAAALRVHRESEVVQRALPMLADLVAETTAHRAEPVLATGLPPGN